MQTIARRSALCILALALPCSGHFSKVQAVRRQRALQAAEVISSQTAAIVRVEADDRSFWSEQWRAMGASLQQLLELSGAHDAQRGELSLVQATNGTGDKGRPADAKTVAGHGAAGSAAGSAAHKQAHVLPKLNLNPKSPADLAPELAMLKGLYESGKERITELNAREKKSKKQFEERQADHDAKIAQIAGRFKNRTLSEEFYKNETRDENRFFKYWQRVRARQHSLFHTSLKIQHATLAKVKTMIGVYEKAIAGKPADPEMKKDLAKVGIVPEVVLLQEAWHSAAPFFGGALAEVRAAANELGSTGLAHSP